MTKAKKMLGMVMAVLMCFALTPMTAFGAVNDNNGKITINDAAVGQDYSVYQILVLESYSPNIDEGTGEDNGAYSYTANSQWESWLKTQTEYVTFDGKYVKWIEGADAAAFAKAAIAQAKKEGSGISPVAGPTPAISEEVTFENLNLGYYLVDSTVGTLCALTTTNPDANIIEKNEIPTVDKQVEEGTNNWGDSNDASIGDAVNFRSAIKISKGAVNYVYHDTMDSGLTFTGTENVKVYKGATKNETPDGVVSYEVVDKVVSDITNTCTITDNGNADECTFEVKFDDETLSGLEVGSYVVIEYSAILNENAKISSESNDNVAYLTYGDKNTVTEEDTTKTYTGGMNVTKVNEQGEGLAGAVFTLSVGTADADAIALVQIASYNPEVAGSKDVFRPALSDEMESAFTDIITNATGEFSIIGLDEGIYYLTEIQAPDGYNKLTSPEKVTISRDSKNIVGFGEANVVNKTGLQLPSTGGMGTTILYIVGGALVIGAIVFLVARRRSSAK